MPDVTSERWRQIESLFEQALGQPTAARDALLDGACAADPELRTTVERLLHLHARADGFLDQLDTGRAAALIQLDHTPEPATQTVGRYRIVRRLGRGGMAVVYLARDERLDRHVALKLLPPWVSADGAAARRLLEEAKAASSLDHPHILTIYEIGETADDRLFLATAFYEGETLRERITRGPLPVGEAAQLATQIASGLAAAHRKGIVHRDIKPENILITTDGVVKILDFGIAKLAGQAPTRPGLTPGTAAYMSPEQTRGGPVDGRSDLWSLGVVLYEMLAAARPFATHDAAALIHGIRADDPAPLASLRDDVTPALARVVERCLAKDPAARWTDAEALLDALRSCSAEPRADAAAARDAAASAHRRRTPALRPVGVALGVAFVLIAAVWWTDSHRTPVEADPDAILVLPFQVATDSALDYLGAGLVELLVTALNGDTASRALRSNVRPGAGRPPLRLARATALARDARAGRLLLGSVVGGPSRLDLSATVHDAATGRVLVRVGARGPVDSLAFLVDAIAGQLLARDAGVPRHQLQALTTTSLPALRAYLEGVGSFRVGRFGAAVDQLEEALRHDSTFALAAIQLVLASRWGELTAEPGTQARALRLAWAARGRLGEPDRLLVEAVAGPRFPASSPRHERLAAVQRALDVAPDRPDRLALMGDFHQAGTIHGEDGALDRAAHFYGRAVELDSGFGWPAYNLIRTAAAAGDSTTVRRILRAYLRADSTGELAQTLRWLDAAVHRDERQLALIHARMPTLHPTALGWIAFHSTLLGLDSRGAERALAALEASARSERELANAEFRRWEFLGNQGRLNELRQAFEASARKTALYGPVPGAGQTAAARAEAQLAIYRAARMLFWTDDTTGVRAAAALFERHYRAWRGSRSDEFANRVGAESACFAGIARLAVGQPAAAAGAVRMLERIVADSSIALPDRPAFHACAAVLDALAAALTGAADARARVHAADSVLQAAPQLRLQANRTHLLLARAYEALDDADAALRVVRRRHPNNPPFFLATFLREEGRHAARTGDREGAIRALHHYLLLRAAPDPEVRLEVATVQNLLDTLLAGEPAPARVPRR